MEEEIVEKIKHEEEGELEAVKEPTHEIAQEKIEQEAEVYDSERAID